MLNPDDDKLSVKVPNLFAAPKWSLEPGEEFTLLWGTGYDAGRAFVEVEHRGKILQAFWTDAGEDAGARQAGRSTRRCAAGSPSASRYVRENRGVPRRAGTSMCRGRTRT